MASKGKKGKKKNVKNKPETSISQSKQEACNSKHKGSICTYFSSEEITDIKSILKVKDANCVPYIIGAIILNKFDLLKKLIKQGCNINESGPNNISALIWAVKNKNMEMIEYLISKGADPTIKTDNGDNVLIVALEHKSWEEHSYINLWNLVKSVTFVDVNYTTKNGHNLLHIAVRRDWEDFIKLLINENVNVNIANSNGVTPLMLACYRNNIKVVTLLLNAGANILKEDNHSRLALCYAISSEVKNSKSPFILTEKVLDELTKHMTIKDYIKQIIDIIISISEKTEFSYSTSEMMVYVTQYIVQYMQNGAKIIIDFDIFSQIAQIMDNTTNPEITKFLLTILMEILFYNEQTDNFNPEVLRLIVKTFLSVELPTICLRLLKNTSDNTKNMLAFYVLVLFSTNYYLGQNWLKDNYSDFNPIYEHYISECFNNSQNQIFNDERRLKTVRKKLKKLKRSLSFIKTKQVDKQSSDREEAIEELETAPVEVKQTESRDVKILSKLDITVNSGLPNNSSSKKIKRRTKALKTKIANLKKVELAERLNLTGKKNSESDEAKLRKLEKLQSEENNDVITSECNAVNTKTYHSKKQETAPKETLHLIKQDENPMVYSILQFLQKGNETNFAQAKETKTYRPLWVDHILNLPFDCPPFLQNLLAINKEKLLDAHDYLKKLSNKEISPTRDILSVVNIVVEYLSELLQIIILKYQNNWENDRHSSLISVTSEEDKDEQDKELLDNYICYIKQIEKREKTAIQELQVEFIELINSIKKLALTDVSECFKNLRNLEATLLNMKTRGKELMFDICPGENVKILYNYTKMTNYPDNGTLLLNYIEQTLNEQDFTCPLLNVKIVIPNEKTTEFVSKDFNSGYPNDQFHEEISHIPKKETKKSNEPEVNKSTIDEAYHLFQSMATICDSEDEKESGKNLVNKFKDEMKLTDHLDKEKTSRWSVRIYRLLCETNVQKLLSGDVLISRARDKYQEYTISQGGNFNPVVLGLTSNQLPLAVKQLPKEHSVCKVMKSLINPLLGLRHKNILHYYACDYEGNELILATPLCEFNIGQYVLFLKETSNNIFNLKPIDIVRQFLLGLKYLHVRKDPIVHGNLKPSNIFVDLNGIVKVAEFGTHKVLYKTVEAPKSSLIWFSQETYQGYKQHSTVDCTCASDIQVSGMLLYFIISAGVHPYGSDVTMILKNLEKAILNLPKTLDVVLVDIVTWMMMYDPNERPNIENVLSHVIFWSDERKWRFILNCAGITHHRDHSIVPLDIDINGLHGAIDKMSIQEKINSDWVEMIRKQFPNLAFGGEDTITGLLRFIRYFCENQKQLETREKDLSKYILTYFPGFTLSLYRILDATNWLKHPIFYEYTHMEQMIP